MRISRRYGSTSRRWLITPLLMSIAMGAAAADAPRTDTLMLSGNGPDDAVSWDFTVSGGMKAGQASKIAVPSNW
ncbi:hypothetical protein PQU92_18080, partial [Asticcacaulis sp. BYS171W]